jgi:predicted N-formylglutamate amidohydrolase
MDQTATLEPEPVEPAFSPVETNAGPLDAGVLIVCDHASNAVPPRYGSLGLPGEALDRHIAYDIGAAALTRALAARLKAPAVLSTFSRLLIDPNRGSDDPTLVMRYSDGAIVPGNARVDAAEIARRTQRFWRPYRERIAATVEAMTAAGEPPALVSIHSFTPVWRGAPRRWKVGVLWDRDDRLPKPLLEALAAEPDLGPKAIGDNEPYDGALAGDTIDAIATSRGLANALIEIRQDLVAGANDARAWGDRLARLLRPILADRATRTPRDFGSRARHGRRFVCGAPAALADRQ